MATGIHTRIPRDRWLPYTSIPPRPLQNGQHWGNQSCSGERPGRKKTNTGTRCRRKNNELLPTQFQLPILRDLVHRQSTGYPQQNLRASYKGPKFPRHEFPHAGSYPSASKSVMWTEQPAKSVEQLEQRVRELQDEKRLLMEEDAQLKARIRQINASNESLRQGIRTLSMKNAKNALDVELARQGM